MTGTHLKEVGLCDGVPILVGILMASLRISKLFNAKSSKALYSHQGGFGIQEGQTDACR